MIENSIDGIKIEKMNKDLYKKFSTSANICLKGDSSCSLENMKNSCFAIEYCDSNSVFPSDPFQNILFNPHVEVEGVVWRFHARHWPDREVSQIVFDV